MWLLETESLALEEVDEPSSVEYAILSHTWEEDEVTFRDISDLDRARQKAGFSKIAKTCELARERGLRYAWVDTCCIDKSSSAELSEAINSMFAWYESSTVCFAFLSDLPPLESPNRPSDRKPGLPYSQEDFGSCRWFTRGWTLQELIAPAHVEFYNSKWELFTRKSECTSVLSRITSIAVSVLDSPSNLRQVPVAVKMSWAASRETKRIEDRAYSLLGIFDIHMPLLYGERHKSFRRLQEEIARESNDLSLFAWTSQSNDEVHDNNFQLFRGIFARSPTEFRGCSRMRKSLVQRSNPEFSLCNRGVMLKDRFQKGTKDDYIMDLRVFNGFSSIGISLVHTANGFVRSTPWSLDTLVTGVFMDHVLSICVLKDVTRQEDLGLLRLRHKSFHVDFNLPKPLKLERVEPNPEHLWDRLCSTFINNRPHILYVANLRLSIRGPVEVFRSAFPLNIVILHGVHVDEVPHVTLDQDQSSAEAPDRNVNTIKPWDVANLFADHVDWKRYHEEKSAGKHSNGGSPNREVCFIDKHGSTVTVTKFSVELETHNLDGGITTYRVILSGAVKELTFLDAVRRAPSYFFQPHSYSGESTVL